MREDFKEFLSLIRRGIESEEIKFGQKKAKLTDFDLAIQYAIGLMHDEMCGKIASKKAKSNTYVFFTIEDIYNKIMLFAPELLEHE